MKLFSRRFVRSVAFGLGSCALGVGTLACSSSNSGGGNNGGGTGGSGIVSGSGGGTSTGCSALMILFTPMYSGYDGVHKYQIPAVVSGVSGAGVTWTSSDDSKVDIAPDSSVAQGGAMLTTKAAGTVTITATAGSLCGSSLLTITQFSPSDWETGNTRYNLSNPVPNPFADGGMPPPSFFMQGPDAGNFLDPKAAPPGCINCHGPTATSGIYKDVAHTPEQTGGFSDTDLAGVFTKGVIPPGGVFDQMIVPQFIWSYFHKWNDISTPDEQRGMVAYLRSLTPSAQGGTVDFGGLLNMRPGGFGNGGTTGSGGTTATATGGTTAASGGTTAASGGTTAASGGTTGTAKDAGK